MEYYYNQEIEAFVIENYNRKKPFASFLPGIAGLFGIPIWTYYVNRGQCIASFGIRDKSNPIMEFYPANKSIQNVNQIGFRTFLKITRGETTSFYEPFSRYNKEYNEKMLIYPDRLEITDESLSQKLSTKVCYFTLPNEDLGALIRKVIIRNKAQENIKLELLDGLPIIIPYGIHHGILKEMSYTAVGWMEVINLENGFPIFKVGSEVGDETNVLTVSKGHFSLTISDKKKLIPIVDPRIIFGEDTSFFKPEFFLENSLDEILKKNQLNSNILPCSFFGQKFNLKVNEEIILYSIIGYTEEIERIYEKLTSTCSVEYFNSKLLENNNLITNIINRMNTETSSKLFDSYCKQTYLDNILRGGFPLTFSEEDDLKVFYLYLRKHGDLERDYNYFYLSNEPYSQGNGNYRDINQNRRCDVFFDPSIKYFNIQSFMNLIQADGFNPLVINGTSFVLKENKLKNLLEYVDLKNKLNNFFSEPFTPGKLYRFLKKNDFKMKISVEEFIELSIRSANQITNATFGEGYWVDHWTYNLDLVEEYLSIYPEMEEELFFNLNLFTFFDSPAIVQPRSEKFVLINNTPKQHDSVSIDEEKQNMISSRSEHKNLVRKNNGQGPLVRTTLASKFICLIINKFSSLDPLGMGIEMEANKPGWYDALNGLPGIFGSSMPETYELKRLILYIISLTDKYSKKTFIIPTEVLKFIEDVLDHLSSFNSSKDKNKNLKYWNSVYTSKEYYRKATKLGFSGIEEIITSSYVKDILTQFLSKINMGIEQAIELSRNKIPTYFYYEIKDYKLMKNADGSQKLSKNGFKVIKPIKVKVFTLPLFLEGYVRYLKLQKEKENARKIWFQVRENELFDKELSMLKLNASLAEQSVAIGRAKAFTSGWLENESIWLHMEYKFLLEMLKKGLYHEFFDLFQTTVIPFLNPDKYGRPTTENSSFIVSSAFPDKKMHGSGYYARLSGSTAEFVNIWIYMMVGGKPFVIENNELKLILKPILPGWLFDKNGYIKFKFLGCCNVTYYNPKKIDTFSKDVLISEIRLKFKDEKEEVINNHVIGAPYSYLIRSGKIGEITAILS